MTLLLFFKKALQKENIKFTNAYNAKTSHGFINFLLLTLEQVDKAI